MTLFCSKKMGKARQKAGLTQDMVAETMHTKKSVIARLEAGGGRNKHSPSLATLQKYAAAIGYKLKIDFVSKKKANEQE